jgi:DNA excision repair protein ERCC-2
MSSVSKPIYTVSVRELVEFVLQRGDLGGRRDFVGSDRALAGTRAHQKLQRSRPPGFQKELRLSYEIVTEEFILRIQGRLDGLLVTPEQTLLEEIKTTLGAWDGTPDPLHWAQAKCYGFFYSQDHPSEQMVIQLTYLALESGEITQFQERLNFAELEAFFDETAAVYLAWIRDRHEWCRRRDESIRSLAFPFSGYRAGQRQLAVAAYRVLAKGGQLFLEAPTGIGKTISVLFPAVKALGERKLERIFYLTARTVGRAIAEKAFADMRRGALQLRTLTLTAKEKICERQGHPCDTSTCPLALGYYDRRQAAMRAALGHVEITRPVLEAVGQQHQVCPFELSLDMSIWVDAIICDYNYVFDPQVYLRRHFSEGGGQYAFLVDEAHNLVDRAREMFSADLDSGDVQAVRRLITDAPHCAKALTKLASGLRKLAPPRAGALGPAQERPSLGELDLYSKDDAPPTRERLGHQHGGETQTSRDLPGSLQPLVERALTEMEAWLVRNQPADFREPLLELYFRLHSFRRTAEAYDECFVTIIESSPTVRVRLFCLDPSVLLSQAMARGRAVLLFSATLRPIEYYRSLLGGDPASGALALPSPFPSEHLAVMVHDGIQTHFKARAASRVQVAEAIGALIQQRRGNYLVYFPSFKYLDAVLECFQELNPKVSVLVQHAGMREAERDAFLAAFRAEQSETLVGFAVMGGVFGEGIDLVGEHLIGAVIVGVGLPQLSIERDLLRDYFQERTANGFGYAYTFPGMNRVLQAIGRVIRCETDRGVVLLIDARFRESRYRQLFPAWWQVRPVRTTEEIVGAARAFWQAAPENIEAEPSTGSRA